MPLRMPFASGLLQEVDPTLLWNVLGRIAQDAITSDGPTTPGTVALFGASGNLVSGGPLGSDWNVGNHRVDSQNSTRWFNVLAYGADSTGTRDSIGAFNAARDDAKATGSGGVVYAPYGTYLLGNTFYLGDGSLAAISTYASVRLIGDGGPVNYTHRKYHGTVLKWGGAPGGVMVNVRGPISGVSIENIILDGNGTAATCLRTDHMSDSRVRNVAVFYFTGEGVITTAYSNPTGFYDGANENTWDNLRIISGASGATGLRVGENTIGTTPFLDVAQNVWTGLNIRMSGVPSTGMKLQFMDACFFYGTTISANTPVDIVPSAGGVSAPADVVFSGYTGVNAFNVNAISNTTPIGVTVGVWGTPGTPTPHGYRTGDWVNIAGSGIAAANGLFKVTVTGATTFTLNGTVASGASGTGGLIEASGFQETSGTWATAPAAGIYCAGLNPEGWGNFPGVCPPFAITPLTGAMQSGNTFPLLCVVSTSNGFPASNIRSVNAGTGTGTGAGYLMCAGGLTSYIGGLTTTRLDAATNSRFAFRVLSNGALTATDATAAFYLDGQTAGGVKVVANAPLHTPSVTLTLANGLNSNVTAPLTSYTRIAGPTAVFSIGGFTTPTDGKILRLYNSVAFAMTLVNEDASSTAANRIKTLTGANVTLRAGTSAATLIYDGTDARWVLVSTN